MKTGEKRLADVLKEIPIVATHCLQGYPSEEILISSIVSDSRKVKKGSLFTALSGGVRDGHEFIRQAQEKGAVAILYQSGKINVEEFAVPGITYIEAEDTAPAYGLAAANFYDRPAESLKIIGVTGTNGKTTVTYLVEQVFIEAGYRVGVVGTVNNRYVLTDGTVTILQTRFTTPEAAELQQVLAEMVEAGVEVVVMEVSSHGLAQARVEGVRFHMGAFTNLSRDHLDYHDGMEDYFAAKLLLFERYMASGQKAILPDDVSLFEQEQQPDHLYRLCREKGHDIVSWGQSERALVRLLEYSVGLDTTTVSLQYHGSTLHGFSSPLIGGYNVENLLCAFSICYAFGIVDTQIFAALQLAAGAPGRLERVTGGHWQKSGPLVLVDYAHTPDALEKVLSTVAELPHNRLYCVFGCGGDRDSGKRPLMGALAAKFSDTVIVTDDNPRTEDPEAIVADILGGITESTTRRDIPLSNGHQSASPVVEKDCLVIRDRSLAIETAVKAAKQGDIVLIAGKGHETYQLTDKGKRFFDDRLQAKEVLCSWTVQHVVESTGGKLISGRVTDTLLGPVTTDSREKNESAIFVALKGDTHDGHDYTLQAIDNGCRCLVVDHAIETGSRVDVSQVVVRDTLVALGDMAAYRRRILGGDYGQIVIGLTGSCGKTTVKEMVASILSSKWRGESYPEETVLKTHGNFNNLIGMPLSLLPLKVHHYCGVLEMGMNVKGEIARLAEIAKPDISCITNIHGAHLLGLGSIDGVGQAKEELFAGTGEQGVLILNLDDQRIVDLSRKYPQKKITFSLAKREDVSVDFWASEWKQFEDGTSSFRLHHRKDVLQIQLHIAGEHNLANALCAAAIATAAGADLEEIAGGLWEFRPSDKRGVIEQAPSGLRIINDTYNANPASMAAALKSLKQLAGGQSIAIIGEMLELGEMSVDAHYQIGRLAAELDLSFVAAVGEFRQDIARGARESGCDPSRIFTFPEKQDAVQWLKSMVNKENIGKEATVLVKASRGNRFETVVDALLA